MTAEVSVLKNGKDGGEKEGRGERGERVEGGEEKRETLLVKRSVMRLEH